MKYFYIIFFLNLFQPIYIFSQSSSPIIQDFHIEISGAMVELQTKNYLFQSNNFSEKAMAGFGGEILFGASFKNNWGIQIGASYFEQGFKNQLPFDLVYYNPNNQEISASDYFISDLNNSFTNYDISFRMGFDGSNCNYPGTPILDGEIISMNFSRSNSIQQIGIPLKLEKLIGKKRNKLYLSLGLIPVINLNDPKKLKYRNNGISVKDHRSGCFSQDGYVNQIQISQINLDFKNQNIINNRLDLNFEIGLLHDLKKNTFKISLFLEESITGFTVIEERKYQSQIAGIKFGLRKKFYRQK